MIKDLRFRRLQVKNWKNFVTVDIALQNRVFLVGPNASGKIGDAEALSRFLGVVRNRIPANPEDTDDPKTTMVNLARHSRRRGIHLDMVPRAGSGRQVGSAFASRLIEYIQDRWRPEVAAKGSDSLRRAIDCLRNLVQRQK